MNRFLLPLLLSFVAPVLFAAPSAAKRASADSPAKWAGAIDKLTANDATHPPAPGGIVFVGSSSIVKWTSLAQDFPDLPVINRGFGGSQLPDSVAYADRIVLPYQPRTVVVYAGDNDIADHKSPESVLAAFQALRDKIHAALPQTQIIFISLKPSPSRWKLHAAMERTNALVAAECARSPHCTFVDVWHPMLDAQGQPRPELFVADQLHMKPAGYAIWREILSPVLHRKGN